MRTSCVRRCAPSVRRILCRHQALAGHPPGRARHGNRSGGDGSDPAVRGPAAGEGAGARAHPGPRPPGSLPDQQSLAGRRPAASASAHWRCPEVAPQSPRATPPRRRVRRCRRVQRYEHRALPEGLSHFVLRPHGVPGGDGFGGRAPQRLGTGAGRPSREGSLVREQPRRRRASCENTLAATPYRAFGEGGCSRHGRCGPSGNGRAGREAARRRRASGWTEGTV